MRRSSAVLVAVVLGAGLLPAASAAADADLPVTTTVREVGGAQAASGSSTMLAYVLEHEVHEDVPTDTPLPGARIDRDDHPEAFDGLWLQGGQIGAWFGGPSDDSANSQFRPSGTLLENLYVENEVWRNAERLRAGDYAELALATTAMNTPTPWDRERGDANGRLEWDHAVTSRQRVTARYGDDNATMDVIMFRADIVARGGDVDARAREVHLPPLVFDLPQLYPDNADWTATTSRSRPYTSYVESALAVPLPQAGKVVLQGSARGYIPEGRSYSLPNGAVMNEWHIPVLGVVTISNPDSGLPAQSLVAMPEGGLVTTADSGGVREIAVEPGQAVVATDGVPALVQDGAGEAPSAERTSALYPDELAAAAQVDRHLAEPVDLGLRSGHGVTVDPDYLGQGLLALHQPANEKATLADLYSAPAVVHDGVVVPLTRDRLVGLRATPSRFGGGITTYGTSWSEQQIQRTRMLGHETWFKSGLLVEAVYEVGDGVHVFLAARMFSFGHSDVPAGRLDVNTHIRALDTRPVDTRLIQFVLVPETETVVQGGTDHSTEFSGPAHSWLTAGDQRARTQYFPSGQTGIVQALRAPAPLTGRGPDPDEPLAGAPLALVYLPTGGGPVREGRTSLWAGSASAAPYPEPDPPPLGQPCGTPQVVDLPVPTSAPAADLQAAWFDADDANLYATIQVRDLPETAPAGTTLRYSLHWRDEHEGRAARATLAADGTWTFEAGLWGLGFFGLEVPGEARTGPEGLVRIAVDRRIIEDGHPDGVMIRDVGAHVHAGASRIDHAPKGSRLDFGLGGDYVVGSCT